MMEKDEIEENIQETNQFVLTKQKGLLEDYIEIKKTIPKNSMEAYYLIRKGIDFGMQLLPTVDDAKEREIINNLYKKAGDELKEYTVKGRNTGFDYQDFGGEGKIFPIYNMKAKDALPAQANPNALDSILRDFHNQQYEYNTAGLQDIDRKIHHILVKYNIVPSSSLESEIEKSIRELQRQLHTEILKEVVK